MLWTLHCGAEMTKFRNLSVMHILCWHLLVELIKQASESVSLSLPEVSVWPNSDQIISPAFNISPLGGGKYRWKKNLYQNK